jgi:biopolymer transport protein TolR
MAGSVGKSRGRLAGINITPLVDVVLVLLIIFMLVVRGDTSDVPNAVPQHAEAAESAALVSDQLVLEMFQVGKQTSVMLNKQPVIAKEFPIMFQKIMASRTDKKLFVSVDDDVIYGDVVYWMSLAEKYGAELVALQIKKPEAPIAQ